jgi:hypothetical protein
MTPYRWKLRSPGKRPRLIGGERHSQAHTASSFLLGAPFLRSWSAEPRVYWYRFDSTAAQHSRYLKVASRFLPTKVSSTYSFSQIGRLRLSSRALILRVCVSHYVSLCLKQRIGHLVPDVKDQTARRLASRRLSTQTTTVANFRLSNIIRCQHSHLSTPYLAVSGQSTRLRF